MRKSNYKQLIILLILIQSECIAQERDPERFLRECDCDRMKEYVINTAKEKYPECRFEEDGTMDGWTCAMFITDMDCRRKIEIFNLETIDNVSTMMSYPNELRLEFLYDGNFDSVSGTCSRSDVTEEQKEYCYDNEAWGTCCIGGLKYFCDGEDDKNVGTDPIHIFLHGLCGVLWVLFIGYAALSGW